MKRFCLADIAGPFYDPEKPFRNWSSFPYYQIDRDTAPYVDLEQLTWGVSRACAYLEQIQAQGYTGIVIDNLAHLVTFAIAPDYVYPSDSPEYQRALSYRSALLPLFERAVYLGMQLFVTADFQWSTLALRQYVGRLTPDNPRLVDVNRWALTELFTTIPGISGIVIRCGETGGAHNQQGYHGHMLYTSTAALRALVDSLLPVCEQYHQLLIIRTWSVGIGETGDLIWSQQRYREVFHGYTSAYLLASIKHGPMDFFRLLPPNPTLGLPGPRQIIELQNRREYELFGMVPSSVARLHQQILLHAIENPQYAGIWAWNATGGWGGGRAVLASDGWSLWTELNSAVTGVLVGDVKRDIPAFVQDWCAQRLGADLGPAVADFYLASEGILEAGWYLGGLKRGVATLGAIYLPTLLWVWWMRPTASLVIWVYLSTAVDNITAALEASFDAVVRADIYANHIAQFAEAAQPIVASARYFAETLAIGHSIQKMMLRLGFAAATHNLALWNEQATQADELIQQLIAYEQRWNADRQFPPLELSEMKRFLFALASNPQILWRRARLAQRIVKQLRSRRRRRIYLASGVGTMLLTGLFVRKSRRSLGVLGVVASSMFVPAIRRRILRATFPWLSEQLYLLPSIFFETGPAFTEWS